MKTKLSDGSIEDENGRIVFFSTERFVREICEGQKCFICGANPAAVKCSDEQVLPDWILRKYRLHSKTITLPNAAPQYKIPCCESCNTRMSVAFETPISNLVEGGYARVVKHVQEHGPWLIFQWLALIYRKTHLKDKLLPFHLDQRKGVERIAEHYVDFERECG